MLLATVGIEPGPPKYIFLFTTFPIPALNSNVVCQMARIFFRPPHTEAPGFEPTPVSRVAPGWDLFWTLYRLSYSAAATKKVDHGHVHSERHDRRGQLRADVERAAGVGRGLAEAQGQDPAHRHPDWRHQLPGGQDSGTLISYRA